MDNFQYSTFQLNHSVCVADAFSSIAYCIELSTTLSNIFLCPQSWQFFIKQNNYSAQMDLCEKNLIIRVNVFFKLITSYT